MSNEVVAINPRPKSVMLDMADQYGMEPKAFEAMLRATVFPSGGTNEQFAAFLLVAKNYNLNPITKEIYAFPQRGGGIVPIVSIDGWMNLLNSHPAFDGMEFAERHDDSGELLSTTCVIHRKDRSHPTVVTEYLSECFRPTDPWKMKHKMLRHKAAIQCGRYAFGFAGIYDEDEADKIVTAAAKNQVMPRIAPHSPQQPSREPPPPPALPTAPREPPPPPLHDAVKTQPHVTWNKISKPGDDDCGVIDLDTLLKKFIEMSDAAPDEEMLLKAWQVLVEPHFDAMSREHQTIFDKAYRARREQLDNGE